ncbi:uncharacterized protein BO96DRAFT_468807 [Aspergillus niger CBS 101883]|uniref:Uncharacterized protein n=2 Tax=Aspergillus niger TaxID=5061 RepID=A2QHR8_ASPNC|nr:uncharacterized protein BO96DRAFT_468807 [Aspergillus niger CBS 101883]XP_059600452.1 hypothetical protein An04g00810 [Aspergillus niger]PYH53104.1 hypothetical protein BO96DRAFT_468807 [Aspergillus niger CBS 101883]CAK38538.1 hypothetical protein An04g00810 [Aspergillus niger]
MNYCKCAWLGASRQPPSTAMQQQLPASAVLRGSLDPLACLVRAGKEKQVQLGIRSTEGLASHRICEGQVRQHINRWALSGARRAQMAWLTGDSLLLNGPRWISARELPFGITMENTDHYVFSYRYGRRGLKVLGLRGERPCGAAPKKMRDFEATIMIIIIIIIHSVDTQ